MNETSLYAELGKAVAGRRKVLGLKQADLAFRVGLSRASIANIELGRQKVLLHQVYRLSEALGLSRIEELLVPLSAKPEHSQPHIITSHSESDLTAKQREQIANLVRVAKSSTRRNSGAQ